MARGISFLEVYMKNDEVLHRPLGLSHIVENVSLQRQNKKKTFPYQGIWIASGSQGAGKTLYIISVCVLYTCNTPI